MEDLTNKLKSNTELNEFQRNKVKFLEEAIDLKNNTKLYYWKILGRKINRFELEKGKDLYKFSEQEIRELFLSLGTTFHNVIKSNFSTASRYIDWTCEKGFNHAGNPCLNIDTNDFLTSSMGTETNYVELDDFYNMLDKLDCSDVDKFILVLLRYGAKSADIPTIKWEDIDCENLKLRICRGETTVYLPIDERFVECYFRCKHCERFQHKKITRYLDYGYAIKVVENSDTKTVTNNGIVNRIVLIRKRNKVHIKTLDLILSARVDYCVDIYKQKGLIYNTDIKSMLITYDGSYSNTRVFNFGVTFELITGIKITKKK